MRKRLLAIIGTPAYRVQINTFHGFCNQIIQQYPENFADIISSESISELESVQLMEEIINSTKLELLKPFGDPLYYLGYVLNAINDLKGENISVKEFEKAVDESSNDFQVIDDLYNVKGKYKGKMKGKYATKQKQIERNKELVTLYRLYQEKLRNDKKYDFSDMILEVIKALESNEQLLLTLQELYQYVLVDEHQDSNKSQNRIIELLCNFYPNPNLFVVGDEKQAIYRFQGASVENFYYFKNLYPQANLINLNENYRSTQTILNGASSLIANNKQLLQIDSNNALIAKSSIPNNQIKLITTTDFFSEFHCIAKDILQKIKEGADPNEIAVIARNNKDLLPVIDEFDMVGLAYTLESDTNILSDIQIQKVILLLRSLKDLGSDELLIRSMHIDALGINPLDIYKLVALSKEKQIPLWDLLSNTEYLDECNLSNPKAIEDVINNFNQWKTDSYNISFDKLFIKVFNESNLRETLISNENLIKSMQKITDLYKEIKSMLEKKPEYNIDDFINYIDLLNNHNIAIKNKSTYNLNNGIHLMTAHKSKGMEFEYVYIINAFDGHWGNGRKHNTGFIIPWGYLGVEAKDNSENENNEDERKLFYVALTRAKKEAIISYSTQSIDSKDQIPSLFVQEINELYKSEIDIKSTEEEFLKNKHIILSPKKLDSIDEAYQKNKEYFAQVFYNKGLSVSGLNNYLECPWRYFFKNLVGLPYVKTKQLKFGNAIHAAIHSYVISLGKSTVNQEFLIESFIKALKNERLNSEDFEQLTIKGTSLLSGYYDKYMHDWKQKLLSEFHIKGVQLSENISINGTIDLIQMLDNGKDVYVYDFKTGRVKSKGQIEGTKTSRDGNYKRQLVFYKLLLNKYHNGNLNMEKAIIDFLEPNSSGNYQRYEYIIQNDEVIALEKLILQCSDEIINLTFWDKRCDDPKCTYCQLRSFIK